MDNHQLARTLFRFSACSFLLYSVIELPDVIFAYRDYTTFWSAREETAIANQNFTRILFRITLQILAAFVVLLRTDHVVSFCARGIWGTMSPPKAQSDDSKA